MKIIKFLHKLILIVPLYLLLITTLILIDLDIEYLKDTHLLHIILGFLLFFATVHIFRVLIIYFGKWLLGKTLHDFTPKTQLNCYKECQQVSYYAGEKHKHIVILLHGFTTSPMDWDILANCLKQEQIDFHAPLIHGFGQINHNLMLSLNKEDWFRQVVDIYDLLAQRYQHISIIGHSMGGMLACYLAQVRPVQELIISAPALFPQKQETFYA
ncbi:MAG: alpha/beta fold hydrolase, partial [Desulfobacteraceae bacterium]|nr:alpha/beta fold hydrolase [Desulfobacteraceae bacterium]